MIAKLWENGYHTTMICIDGYQDSVPEGRFYNQLCPEGVQFHGVIDLVKKIEAMLDKICFPQAFSKLRSFAAKPLFDLNEPTGDLPQTGDLATFALRILFRQNTSWQGSVTWCEGQQEETFRSALELLFLIDSAIRTERASN